MCCAQAVSITLTSMLPILQTSLTGSLNILLTSTALVHPVRPHLDPVVSLFPAVTPLFCVCKDTRAFIVYSDVSA